MDALRVGRLAARYRVPAGDGGARARLDRVLRDVVRQALDGALAQAGVPLHEEVCIRHVDAPARLRASDGDDALAAAWSAALARAIRATLDAGGPGVVRYATPHHAVADVVLSVAAGDVRRAWAWRQMEMWRESDAPPPAAAAEEAARVLLSHPEAIVPALAEAARRGALSALATRVRPATWTAVARAALRAADADASLLLASPAPVSRSQRETASEPPPSPDVAEAARRIAASPLARAVAVSSAGEETRRAFAALAVLEAEPAAFRRPARSVALVAAVETEMGEMRDGVRRVRPASPASDPAPRRNRASDRGASVDSSDAHASPPSPIEAARPASPPLPTPGADDATAGEMEIARVSSPDAREGDEVRSASPDDRRSDDTESVRGGTRAEDASSEGEATEGDEAHPLVSLRAAGETRWGGLLFLVHVLGAPELLAMAEGDALAARSLRWTLHRLAMELTGVEEGDAGALALAGLGPDRDPPSRGAPQATEAEARAVADLAAAAARETHRRVRREEAADDRAALATLRDVCLRRAEIVADPGWIDVRMRHDEVRVDVRRAGLDLDPGWVPWLGVVVRFAYE